MLFRITVIVLLLISIALSIEAILRLKHHEQASMLPVIVSCPRYNYPEVQRTAKAMHVFCKREQGGIANARTITIYSAHFTAGRT